MSCFPRRCATPSSTRTTRSSGTTAVAGEAETDARSVAEGVGFEPTATRSATTAFEGAPGDEHVLALRAFSLLRTLPHPNVDLARLPLSTDVHPCPCPPSVRAGPTSLRWSPFSTPDPLPGEHPVTRHTFAPPATPGSWSSPPAPTSVTASTGPNPLFPPVYGCPARFL